MSGYAIVRSSEYDKQLDALLDRLLELGGSGLAMRFAKQLESNIAQLEQFPRLWPLSRSAILASRGARTMVVNRQYVVLYVVNDAEEQVVVQAIHDGRSNYQKSS